MLGKFKSRRKNKREGSSLVSVIIGVVFLSAIGLTVLTVASKYLVTVLVDRNSSDNFYQTEGILEEVRTGLLEYAGDASEEAYTKVLENYTAEKSSMKEVYAKKYLSALAKKINDDHTVYTEEEVETKAGVLIDCGSSVIDKLKKFSVVPDAVQVKTGSNLQFVTNYDSAKGYTLTLKNLFIDYTDTADYRSTINTDIVFRVPDYKFEGDSTLDELKDYISVSDDMLSVDSMANIKTSFTGNVYSGQQDSGIQIASGAKVDFNSKTIISRGSLDVLTGSQVRVQGESGAGDLWLQNIRLKKYGDGGSDSNQTTFTMNENAYVANDFNIEDNSTKVTLAGKYYGYSYNKENSLSASEKANAEYSSAILINGLNTTLDAKNLEKMILAGRAFVSQNKRTGNSLTPSESDIITGESMSVKSNQLAYLVPDSFIPGEHNPLATAELTATAEMVIRTNLLNSGNGLKDYLNASEPYTANYNSAGYVFLFLNFKDEASANQYFKDFYMGEENLAIRDEEGNLIDSREELAERAQSYLVSQNMGNSSFSGNMYLIAGNIVYNYEATNGSLGMQSANYYDSSGKPQGALLEDGKKMALNYLGRCLTLLSSGSEGRTGDIRLNAADYTTENRLVSGKILDLAEINNLTNAVTKKDDSSTGGRITVAKGSYEISSNDKGIVIATGDVTVSADFTGLILTTGQVKVTGNHTLKADMVLVGNLFEVIKKDEDLSKIFKALNGSGTQDATKLEKCVSYQDWSKNE